MLNVINQMSAVLFVSLLFNILLKNILLVEM